MLSDPLIKPGDTSAAPQSQTKNKGKRNNFSLDSANSNTNKHCANEWVYVEKFKQQQISDVVTELQKIDEAKKNNSENLVPEVHGCETLCSGVAMVQGDQHLSSENDVPAADVCPHVTVSNDMFNNNDCHNDDLNDSDEDNDYAGIRMLFHHVHQSDLGTTLD